MTHQKAITFGSNIDTDQILGAQYLTLSTIGEMAKHTFENYPDFVNNFTKGDIIVGEENFGCGSSREQAPAVLKELQIGAIVAKSFARIFFRNAINQGILLLECPEASEIELLEPLEIEDNFLRNPKTDRKYEITPLPPFMHAILKSGGIVNHLKKNTVFQP